MATTFCFWSGGHKHLANECEQGPQIISSHPFSKWISSCDEIILSSKTGPQSNLTLLTLLFRNYIFFARGLPWGVCPSGTMPPLWRGVNWFFQLEGKESVLRRNYLGAKTGPKLHMTSIFENYIFFASSLQWEVFLSGTMLPLWSSSTAF